MKIKSINTFKYFSGFSTEKVLLAVRLGDSTLRFLYMPLFKSEQSHHIHSTARIVYIKSGQDYSLVGMGSKSVKKEIVPEKICPHHFLTELKSLTVVLLHIWSSVQHMEHNHPMFNGTPQIG